MPDRAPIPPDADIAFFAARHEFSVAYCRERGWPLDPFALSWEQIMEIRSQDGWKNPVKS